MLNSYNLKNFGTVLFEVVKGKQHGYEIAFWGNGERNWESSWINGNKHGEEIHYYWESGGVRWERSWESGKQHGVETGYYEDGKINWISNWKDGKKHEEINYCR